MRHERVFRSWAARPAGCELSPVCLTETRPRPTPEGLTSSLQGSDGAAFPSGTQETTRSRPVAPPNYGKLVHAAFRGRYPLVIGLGLLVGGIGAALGWKLAWPTFRSEGLVRIAYTVPAVDQP